MCNPLNVFRLSKAHSCAFELFKGKPENRLGCKDFYQIE